MINNPLLRCKPKLSEKCVSKKGWPVGKEVEEFSQKKYGYVVCYHCQPLENAKRK